MILLNTSIEENLWTEQIAEISKSFWDTLGQMPGWQSLTFKEILSKYKWSYQLLKWFYETNNEWADNTVEYVKLLLDLILKSINNNYSQSNLSKEPRIYQSDFIKNTFEFINNSKENAWYIHSATWTGKTVVFSEVVRHILTTWHQWNILIVTSSRESQKRAIDEFKSLNIDAWIYNWNTKEIDKQVTVITRQSLAASSEEKINPESISLMICDEIHDGFLWEVMTKEIFEKFHCKKIWFTATPELRNKHVEDIFSKKIWEYLIDEAQKDWFLPEINSDHTIELDDSFFEWLNINGWEYTEESLNKFKVDEVFQKVLDFFKEWAWKGKQFSIAMPSVDSSKRLEKLLSDNWINTKHIDGKTNDNEVDSVKQQFEKKEIQIITSCEKMNQSWDSDVIDWAMNLRPTLSPAKYFQILWRALHWKEIDESGNKIPKKEIMMVDIVNSRDNFHNRTITSSWINSVLSWLKSVWRDYYTDSNLSPNQIVSELEMYYNISQWSIQAWLKEYCEEKLINIKELEERINNDSLTEEEQKASINLSFISSSALWEWYSWRKKDFSITLETLWFLLRTKQQKLGETKNKHLEEFKQYVHLLSDNDFTPHPTWSEQWILLKNWKIFLNDANIERIRNNWFWVPVKHGSSKRKITLQWIIHHLGIKDFRKITSNNIKNISDKDVLIIVGKYFTSVGLDVINIHDKQSKEIDKILKKFSCDTLVRNLLDPKISSFLHKGLNLAIKHDTWNSHTTIDTSNINISDFLVLHNLDDERKWKPVIISSEIFNTLLGKILTWSNKQTDIMFIGLENTKNNFFFKERWASPLENNIEKNLQKLFMESKMLTIISDTEKQKAQHKIKEILDKMNLSQLWITRIENSSSALSYQSSDFSTEAKETILNSVNSIEWLEYPIELNEIIEEINQNYNPALSYKALEDLFSFAWYTLSDTYLYPLSGEEMGQRILEWQWRHILHVIDWDVTIFKWPLLEKKDNRYIPIWLHKRVDSKNETQKKFLQHLNLLLKKEDQSIQQLHWVNDNNIIDYTDIILEKFYKTFSIPYKTDKELMQEYWKKTNITYLMSENGMNILKNFWATFNIESREFNLDNIKWFQHKSVLSKNAFSFLKHVYNSIWDNTTSTLEIKKITTIHELKKCIRYYYNEKWWTEIKNTNK